MSAACAMTRTGLLLSCCLSIYSTMILSASPRRKVPKGVQNGISSLEAVWHARKQIRRFHCARNCAPTLSNANQLQPTPTKFRLIIRPKSANSGPI
jgi:hypothetical protein